ncbi:MAG: hypothetical protein K2P94_14440 [Rhodospirillaceae bacterium]|nr:hypothetical protein [Rhodospirillaceae bacterium]
MKNALAAVLFLAATAAVMPALAHDPSLHKKNATAAPDCSAIEHGDMSKVDLKDPVQKALHDKCMKLMPQKNAKEHDMKEMPDMAKKPEQTSVGK